MLSNEQMAELRDTFRTEVLELLSELEATMMDLEERPDDADLTNRAFRALHSIKGSGTMFGFDDMSEFVHEIEDVFDRIRKGELAVTGDLIDLTLKAKDELLAMLNRSGPDTSPRQGSAGPILDGYRAYMSGAGQQGESSSDAPSTETHHYRIIFRPQKDILKSGTDPGMLLDELSELGTCRTRALVDGIPPLGALIPDECYLGWQIDLETTASEDDVRAVFVFVLDDAELSINRQDAGPQTENEPQEGGRQSAAVATDSVSVGAPATIRVPSDRLDSLVDLVGELVTVQAQFGGHVTEASDPVLLGIAESIERLTNELRDNAMSLRMVPARPTFSRLRRLVRDLASQLGKDVRFETSGEETELDKTVIERLGDPLMHLIRNSMDHGLEAPEVREAAGKPRTGTIHLSAAHEGASVAVTVEDDGSGLDLEAIKSTAIARGIIDADTEMSEEDTMQLIFAPGFSTARSVTDVSGRGVGMDVVRKTLEQLGGTLETSSEPGRGTCVALRLPLTLAIIDGLLVSVAGQHYVLPLSSVHELFEFDIASLHQSGSRRLIENRGTMLPYIDLHEVFETGRSPSALSRVVVVDWRGSTMGVVVDDVLGQQQTVIKSLSALVRHSDGVSGATILGDGSVALILDVPRLVADHRLSQQPVLAESS